MKSNRLILAMYLFFILASLIIGIIDLVTQDFKNAIFPLVMSLIFVWWAYYYYYKHINKK